jgi:hypothetical protein
LIEWTKWNTNKDQTSGPGYGGGKFDLPTQRAELGSDPNSGQGGGTCQ